MSISKAELKAFTLHNVGSKVDDLLETAHKAQASHGGAKAALFKAAKDISGLNKIADAELEQGKIPDIPTLDHVKRFVARASVALENAARHFENMEIAANGSANFGAQVVKLVKGMHDLELAKAEALKLTKDSPEDEMLSQSGLSRPVGARPGSSIAQQRRAEEAATKDPPKPKKTRKKKAKSGKDAG